MLKCHEELEKEFNASSHNLIWQKDNIEPKDIDELKKMVDENWAAKIQN